MCVWQSLCPPLVPGLVPPPGALIPQLLLVAHTCVLLQTPLANRCWFPAWAQEVIPPFVPLPSLANDPLMSLSGMSPVPVTLQSSLWDQAGVGLQLRPHLCHPVSRSLLPGVLPINHMLRTPSQALLLGGPGFRQCVINSSVPSHGCAAVGMPLDSDMIDLRAYLGRSGLLGGGTIPSICHLQKRQVLTQETRPFRQWLWARGSRNSYLPLASLLRV